MRIKIRFLSPQRLIAPLCPIIFVLTYARVICSFKFTRLDKDDPKSPFTFILSVDENKDYILSNVNPPLDKSKTDPVLETLNADGKNGFNLFAVGMSK